MNKSGFTLAEVLLTLAIIGVIAALTIPAVITKVTQDQYVVGLKKAYNTLKSVEREAVQENGGMEHWDWSKDVTVQFNTYFRPHFDILKDCGATTDDGCFAPSHKFLGDTLTETRDYNTTEYEKIITSDGMAFAYRKLTTDGKKAKGMFYVDVNGKKGPNKFGRDFFIFNVLPSALGVKAEGTVNGNNPDLNYNTGEVNGNCASTNGRGDFCAAKVLSEGAMNY